MGDCGTDTQLRKSRLRYHLERLWLAVSGVSQLNNLVGTELAACCSLTRSKRMAMDRRGLITAGAGVGLVAGSMALSSRGVGARETVTGNTVRRSNVGVRDDRAFGVSVSFVDDETLDQTKTLQDAIDLAAQSRRPVLLPAGRFLVSALTLRDGTTLVGAHGKTSLLFGGGPVFITADNGSDIRLEGLTFDGRGLAQELVAFRSCQRVAIECCEFRLSIGHGLSMALCSGRVANCDVSYAGMAGIFSVDATGMEICDNRVHKCSNNGIQVWRSKVGDDGSVVSRNRVFDIASRDGGSGQNGNGINVYRAGGVMVSDNQISDCAYSAVRGNAASNIQIIGNSCARMGEVAIYSEFGFEGAVISSNIVDTAACGIAVTNFNEGGRLVVVHGNLVRNLFRREHEPQDKRGEGIAVEADASVVGNTIEAAQSVGLSLGWGPYMRDVVANGNVIRSCPVGIAVTSDKDAGACVVSQNLISGAIKGAIRAMDRGHVHGRELSNSEMKTGRVLISGNMAV